MNIIDPAFRTRRAGGSRSPLASRGAAVAMSLWALALVPGTAGTTGCIGGQFHSEHPAPQMDGPTRAVFDRITEARTAKNLASVTWVEDLRPPAFRAARSAARGDQPLTAATTEAAQAGVTAMGRHVWSFGADCADLQRFRPPAAVTQKTLLLGAAAVPGPAGHTYVILLIADPGTSALRADQMGGGRGGSNPSLHSYAHAVVATGPCGESWPAATVAPF